MSIKTFILLKSNEKHVRFWTIQATTPYYNVAQHRILQYKKFAISHYSLSFTALNLSWDVPNSVNLKLFTSAIHKFHHFVLHKKCHLLLVITKQIKFKKNTWSCIISKLTLSHKLCSPITCSCQIITNTRVILKLLWCDNTSSSKDSPPFQRNLLPSCTTNRQHHIQKQSVPGLPAHLKYCYSVIIHSTRTFIQRQCPSQLW